MFLLMMVILWILILTYTKRVVKNSVQPCPPHQWDWEVVVGPNGEKITERIVCKKCGPLNQSRQDSQDDG